MEKPRKPKNTTVLKVPATAAQRRAMIAKRREQDVLRKVRQALRQAPGERVVIVIA